MSNSLKTFSPAIALLISLGACTTTDIGLLSGNATGALDLARGSGAVQRSQDGVTTFRYAFSQSGLDGLVAEDQQESIRLGYIGQFIANEGICARGWIITNRQIIDPSILYEWPLQVKLIEKKRGFCKPLAVLTVEEGQL